MKALIILSLTLISFNVFAADNSEMSVPAEVTSQSKIGPDPKSNCTYANQGSRAAKLVDGKGENAQTPLEGTKGAKDK